MANVNSENRWPVSSLFHAGANYVQGSPVRISLTLSADQMCPQLSPDEKLASEERFKLYCKSIEWYNIIQLRAAKNVSFFLKSGVIWHGLHVTMMAHWLLQPAFLQRCLDYMIEARRKKRYRQYTSVDSLLLTLFQNTRCGNVGNNTIRNIHHIRYCMATTFS